MFDRDAVVAAVDLRALADELLGQHRGSARAPMWSCPNPDHPQTGRTPPVSIFVTHWGEQRWRCHGCGDGGSAVDLVMRVKGAGAREALAFLAKRVGIAETAPGAGAAPAKHPVERRTIHRPSFPTAVPELDRYVTECATALWRPPGAAIRRWLTNVRCLPEEVLRANRIGADLGPRRQDRPDGVPAIRRGVVLPVLLDGNACYVQLRTLGASPNFPRYLNSAATLSPNPRVGVYRPPSDQNASFAGPEVLVTEGIIDALTAASAGYTAVAVLGASYSDPLTAMALARIPGRLVVAFDPDPAGRAGSDQLVRLLRAHRREVAVLNLKDGDLNEHLVRATDWRIELPARLQYHTISHQRPGLAIA